MLELKNISKSFSDKKVIENFSLKVSDGEKVCLMGPSGCGKTTILRIASGLTAPDSGEVVNTFKRVSYVFQENRLLTWYNALQNITCLGIEKEKASKYLCSVGLQNELESFPDELSGGMARRLALARALAFDGDAFFIDEAFYGLDEMTKSEMLKLFKEELSEKSALIVTHDLAVAKALSDRIINIF